MGGSSGGTSQQVNKPIKQLRPAFQAYGNEVTGFIQNPGTAFDIYQGPTQPQISPYSQQAVSALANPEYFNQSQNYYQNVLAGDYLGLPPQYQQAVLNPVLESVNGRYNALGRYGSQANVDAATEAGLRALTPYYGQERALQQNAAGLSPAMGLQQAGALQGAGALQQGFGARDIQEAMNQFYQQNYDPRTQALPFYGNLLGAGSPYGSQTVSQDAGSGSRLAGAVGGGLLGAGAATSLWGPGALAAGSFAAPLAWPLVGGGLLAGGLFS